MLTVPSVTEFVDAGEVTIKGEAQRKGRFASIPRVRKCYVSIHRTLFGDAELIHCDPILHGSSGIVPYESLADLLCVCHSGHTPSRAHGSV